MNLREFWQCPPTLGASFLGAVGTFPPDAHCARWGDCSVVLCCCCDLADAADNPPGYSLCSLGGLFRRCARSHSPGRKRLIQTVRRSRAAAGSSRSSPGTSSNARSGLTTTVA